ncbi:hypothetical protein K2P56_01025 [Patescibacteria group bacterium]|nr:hypothetical protein [Patescibacteria group bacterium]
MGGWDKTRRLEKFSGLARAKGPLPFRAVKAPERVSQAYERGRQALENANVEDGFVVELTLVSKAPQFRRDGMKISGIMRIKLDLVSGEIAQATLDGQQVHFEKIRSVRVLVGRKEAPPQGIVATQRTEN